MEDVAAFDGLDGGGATAEIACGEVGVFTRSSPTFPRVLSLIQSS